MFKTIVLFAIFAFAVAVPAPEAKAAPEPKAEPGVAFTAPLVSAYSAPVVAAPAYSYGYSTYAASPYAYAAPYAYPAGYSAPIVYA